jgi:hypothetical protein
MDITTAKIRVKLTREIVASATECPSQLDRAPDADLSRQASTTPFVSALDRAANLVGCFEGGPEDLASNPAHLDGFGRT